MEPLLRDARGRVLRVIGDARCRGPARGVPSPAAVKRFEERGWETFFGYYDMTPFDASARRLLACRVPIDAVPGRAPMQVGYFETESADRSFRMLGETRTWCWQQGCRLRWLPGSGDSAVMYNDLWDNRLGTVVIDAASGSVIRRFAVPIYAVDPGGGYALSLNFARLQFMRPGYGYDNLADEHRGEPCPAADGIWRVELCSGERSLILSLEALAGHLPHQSMARAVHYVNHLMPSPNGSRIMFMHLWVDEDGRRHNRLLSCNADGSGLWAIADTGRVSHSWWNSDTEILAYTWHAQDDRHRFRLYRDGRDGYLIDSLSTVDQDGHPSLSPDGCWLISDTYPDLCRTQWLLLQHRECGMVRVVRRFRSPARFTADRRCDLHPRWSPAGTHVAVDTTHNGRRALWLVDLRGPMSDFAK